MTEFQVPSVPIRTTVPGAEIQIGKYGVATNTAACLVPEHVAQELAGREEFEVGGPAPAGEAIGPEDQSRSLETASEDEPETPKKKARKGEER